MSDTPETNSETVSGRIPRLVRHKDNLSPETLKRIEEIQSRPHRKRNVVVQYIYRHRQTNEEKITPHMWAHVDWIYQGTSTHIA